MFEKILPTGAGNQVPLGGGSRESAVKSFMLIY